MHCLEYIISVTATAVKKDEISKAELIRILRQLAGLSHYYTPEKGEPAEIVKMNDEWHRRFSDLLYEKE